MRYYYHSEKGIKRDINQDRYLILSNSNLSLFVIFDGVSSHKESYKFVENFINIIKYKFENLKSAEFNISDTFYNTNLDLLSKNINGYSTISILVIYPDSKNIKFLNIGDSRIYNFTNSYLEKITADDNLGEKNNILTKFLGSDLLTTQDFELKTLEKRGNYLLCTDGFYSLMEENLKRYFKILNFKYPKRMFDALVTEQLNVNRDDSTFIIVKNEI